MTFIKREQEKIYGNKWSDELKDSGIDKVYHKFISDIEKYDKVTGKTFHHAYMTVAGRLKMLWDDVKKDKDKTIACNIDTETNTVKIADKYVVKCKAKVIIGNHSATGNASEVIGEGQVNEKSAMENAETSAVGRALGNLGYGLIGAGGVASADEMQIKLGNVPVINYQEKEESEEETTEIISKKPVDRETKITAKELSMIKPITQLLKNAVSESELEAAKAAAGIAKESLNNTQLLYLKRLFEETKERLN